MFRGPGPRTLTGAGEAAQINCADVTASFFKTFHVQLALGRAFNAATRPGRRDSALNGTPYTVIGVMAPSFRFPGQSVEAITPLAIDTAAKAIYFIKWWGG